PILATPRTVPIKSFFNSLRTEKSSSPTGMRLPFAKAKTGVVAATARNPRREKLYRILIVYAHYHNFGSRTTSKFLIDPRPAPGPSRAHKQAVLDFFVYGPTDWNLFVRATSLGADRANSRIEMMLEYQLL